MPNTDNEPQLPKNQSPIVDDRTGLVSRDWYRFFLNLLNRTGSGTVTSVNVSGGTTGLTTSGGPVTTSGTITLAGTLDVDNGGTGQTTAAAAITALTGTQTSGYYLRSDGTNAVLSAIQVADVPTLNQNTTGQAGSVANALTAGTGISYSAGTTYDGSVAITINNSAPDQTVSLTGGTGISTSGTYPNFTITNTGVTSFNTRTGNVTLSSTDVTTALTYTPVNKAGDTMTGKLNFPVVTTSASPINLGQGSTTTAPTAPVDGDVWINATNGLQFRISGATRTTAALQTAQSFSALQTFNAGITCSIGAVTFGQTASAITLGAATSTGTITVGQTTGASQTINIQAGALTSGFTKTINIGTGGLSGSTTTMAIGSTNGTTVAANGSWTFPTTITGSVSGTASNVTGTVAVANGGTGLTSIAALSVPVANTANTYTTVTGTAGQSIRVNAGGTAWEAYTPTSGTVTSVTGTSPVVSSGGATPAISLASGYGDTQNPYASKTANFFLAAPNGTAGVPTFRAIVAADIPTLNQNTTGTASNVTGTVAIANGGTGATTAATARTNLGATTVGSNFFTLANPSAITFVRINADNTVSTLDAATFRTAIGAGTGNGTVTSVTGTSPVASSGGTTPAISLSSGYGDTQNPYASKTANFVLAAPNGVAGVPTFRAIVAADIPTLNQNTTGTASNVTGTVAIANGGTGQTTQQTAINALAGAVTSGQYLRGNGTNVVMSAIQVADVPTLNQNTTGTASNVTGTVAIANGGTGQTTQQTAINALAGAVTSGQFLRGNGTNVVMAAIQASDVPTLNQNTTGTASNVTGVVAVANGGSGQTTAQTAMNTFAGAVTSGQYLRGNGTNVVMSAIQAADVPTLNQNTTGTASNVTGTVAIANGGTGQTTKVAAFDALSPASTKGDLIAFDGTDNVRLPVGADGLVLQADSTQTTGLKWAAAGSSGATITNDTSTSTNVYPTFAAATSGALSTIYTSNAKYLYKPSTGELTSEHFIAGNGIFVNNLTIDVSYTIAAGTSGMSAGPITVASGTTVTVASGSRWVVM